MAGKGAGFRAMLPRLLVDVVLPVVLFVVLHRVFDVRDLYALIAASAVPALGFAVELVLHRRVDGLAVFMVCLFGVGIAMALISGDARFVLARESAFTGFVGCAFIGSIFVGRPLINVFGRKFAESGGIPEMDAPTWDKFWTESAEFRKGMNFMTAVWGVALILESILRVIVVYTIPVDASVFVSPALYVVTFGLLVLWTPKYAGRIRERVNAAA
ncbi:VC0807 family protein [Amycolatopsis sp. A133]|uniref:VC0807 family protein n=1 Tax=Amycolatopsis sp. A133 TaxID=3064472 RepID=UPI0027E7A3BD|nr:VC0807 family protein [Amycolatopsis sp. A133]MDQ7803491.1 VC0807 family protein [Amycolatopsis sp. A133]